ncbi:sensor histidine kinase [Marinigracilibium pacificum]|uniref:histidine kinase n=1 Tax=Marinigracilibium pacificum TaxID=2729599 RepID=A0A848IRU7_9BACT|nr:HAMP domain-containing sensor histidine kinase [Marinigracilibium pacificum]NMM47193.1 HAMP domain-containing histidine kinase [Marinigracilibium pacificum]
MIGFSIRFNKTFLSFHAYAWLVYAIHLVICLTISLLLKSEITEIGIDILLFVFQFTTYLFIFLFSAGMYVLFTKKSIAKIYTWLWIGGGLIYAALVTYFTFLFKYDPEHSFYFHFMIQSIVLAVIFIYYGQYIRPVKKEDKKISSYIIVSGLTGHGVLQFYYFITLLLIFSDYNTSKIFYSTYGYIDSVTISLMGLGFFLWLLERESANFMRTGNELDQFLYRTSHDIRSPITTLKGLIYLAKHETNVDDLRMYFEKIDISANRLQYIVDDISSFSQIKKYKPVIKRLNFKKYVEENILNELEFKKNDRDIEIIVQTETENNEILTDPLFLKIILKNLVSNAITYHKPSREDMFIKIFLEENKYHWILSVIDNGSGIDKSIKDKIFDMFFRGTNESTGTGLGLFIVSIAVKKLRGEIKVDSTTKNGSTFKILIPKSPAY